LVERFLADDFLEEERFLVEDLLRPEDFRFLPVAERFLDELFFGTFPPSRRACERPIAIACFLLVTLLPERPLRSVPRLRSRIAFSTFFDAFLPYFLAMRSSPSLSR
jgi:hypothetical protein